MALKDGGGDQDYNSYITETFTENCLPRFIQHYYVTDWEDYGEDEACPTRKYREADHSEERHRRYGCC